jgi:hypothetical protein
LTLPGTRPWPPQAAGGAPGRVGDDDGDGHVPYLDPRPALGGPADATDGVPVIDHGEIIRGEGTEE